MAPRIARAKKNTEVQSVEIDAPKKGRGKAKIEKVVESNIENENHEENVEVPEKKTKRGKKPVDVVKENGVDKEVTAPAPKKGRKKNVETEKIDNDSKESTPADENEEEEEVTNGDAEVIVSKSQKKQTKKETKPKEPAKSKKATKQVEEKEVEQKLKGKGRKPKAEKVEESADQNMDDEEIKPDPPAAKGRRKGKVAPAKSEETEKENGEEKSEPELKKKETKGRKNATKKAPSTQESEGNEEELKDEASVEKKEDKKETLKQTEKGDANQEDSDAKEDESAPEVKPAKGKRGQKKTVEKETDAEDVQDTGEPATKRRRKVDATEEKKAVSVKSVTDYESIDFANTSKNAQGKEWNFKISTWNVDGVRAWLSKGGLEYVKYEKPDILCLQETKCSQEKLPTEITNLPGYHAYWLCSDKDGYAGVGVYTTKLAMNVQYGLQNEELDSEGRIITAEYELFFLICTYVPNAGRKLVTLPKRLKWNEEFRKHVQMLDKKKPVIICGDMNVAHNEIDLKNPKSNKKNAGFTAEEREGMTELLGDGFVDVYRHYYPDKAGAYTFWTYMCNSRAKNVGWRLDYFIVSQRLLPSICDSVIRDKVYGSDHCPLSLFLHLTSADVPKE